MEQSSGSFERRMPSRAAAVRELLKRDLAAEGFGLAEGGTKSEDFRVTGGSAASPARIGGRGPTAIAGEWISLSGKAYPKPLPRLLFRPNSR